MKKILVLLFLLSGSVVVAQTATSTATSTPTPTPTATSTPTPNGQLKINGVGLVATAQEPYVQQNLTARANGEICGRFNLPSTCTQGQLLAAGCVEQPISAITKTNLQFQVCTPLTQDFTGEANLLYYDFGRAELDRIRQDKVNDQVTDCAIWRAMSRAQKDAQLAAATPPMAAGGELCP